ncbi:MAG: exodeoxyribonuclease V subunit alpha [Actinomycetota bacterium]|nr:exodeoxyribonuclease V subunit alpha [Actinomycetota bacterium]
MTRSWSEGTAGSRPGVLAPYVAAGFLDAAAVHVAEVIDRAVGGVDDTVLLAAALTVRALVLGHVCVVLGEVSAALDPASGADPELDSERDVTPVAGLVTRPAPVLGPGSDPVSGSAPTARTGFVAGPGSGAAGSLSWPDLDEWVGRLRASPVVRLAGQAPGGVVEPLVLDGPRLYLDRYWRYESQVAVDLVRRAASSEGITLPGPSLQVILDRLFGPDRSDRQRRAAELALTRRLAVVAGGPGTGKTRTVARLLAAAYLLAGDPPVCAVPPLDDGVSASGSPEAGSDTPLAVRGGPSQSQRASRARFQVIMAAPTGKAAARMSEAVRAELGTADIPAPVAAALAATEATTVHRLIGLGHRAGARRHHRDPLPYDLVVIDELSMVSLPLLTRLLDAVRPDATVVLVGDPDQLASVEAGAVLGEIVEAVITPPTPTDTAVAAGDLAPKTVETSSGATGASPATSEAAPIAGGAPAPAPATAPATPGPLAGCVVVLDRPHRFGSDSAIASLADAVRAGDGDRAVDALRHAPDGELRWVDGTDHAGIAAIEADAGAVAREVVDAARAGDAERGLRLAGDLKVLCATRHGPTGVRHWTERIEALLGTRGMGGGAGRAGRAGRAAAARRQPWYVGRPVLVTANDYRNRLFNGDVGLVVAASGDPVVVFEEAGAWRRLLPSQLGDVDTWWAATVHKSQGSEVRRVVVVLPPPPSPMLTRELLYTAITRAREHATIVATESSIRAAVARRVTRASGLGARLR